MCFCNRKKHRCFFRVCASSFLGHYSGPTGNNTGVFCSCFYATLKNTGVFSGCGRDPVFCARIFKASFVAVVSLALCENGKLYPDLHFLIFSSLPPNGLGGRDLVFCARNFKASFVVIRRACGDSPPAPQDKCCEYFIFPHPWVATAALHVMLFRPPYFFLAPLAATAMRKSCDVFMFMQEGPIWPNPGSGVLSVGISFLVSIYGSWTQPGYQ